MNKAKRTRQFIIQQSAPLFNRYGFQGTSLSDIMNVTHLQKGGIYGHFESKEAIALEAFEYSYGLTEERLVNAMAQYPDDPLAQLIGMIEAFGTMVYNPPIEGGCALLNTAVESDDTNPALKAKAQHGLARWMKLIRKLVREGIEAGQLAPHTDGEKLGSLLVGSLEGALMLSKLTNDPRHMEAIAEHLVETVQALAI